MSEMDVVELSSANVVLPNMTIQVEDKDSDEKVADFNYDQEVVDEAEDENQVKVSFINSVCTYENEKYKRLTELGLTFEEEKKIKNNRAMRFKLEVQKDNEVEVDRKKVQSLLENVLKRNECLDISDPEYIRTDALYIYGVSSLTTQQVFMLFDDFLPKKIEWINDDSCVVVWNNKDTAVSVLLKVTVPKSEEDDSTENENKNLDKLDDIDLMDTSTSIDKEDSKLSDSQKSQNILKNEKEIASKSTLNPLLNCVESFTIENLTGFKLRLACLKDKKSIGSNKRSHFYRKHGNPHYGGAKGILSNSYRRKYQVKRTNIELEDLNVETSRMREAKRQRKIGAFKYQREKTEEQMADEELMSLSARNLEGALKYKSSEKVKVQNKFLPEEFSNESESEDSYSENSDDDGFPYNTMVADKEERLQKISMKNRLNKGKTNKIETNPGHLRSSSGKSVDLRNWLKTKK